MRQIILHYRPRLVSPDDAVGASGLLHKDGGFSGGLSGLTSSSRNAATSRFPCASNYGYEYNKVNNNNAGVMNHKSGGYYPSSTSRPEEEEDGYNNNQHENTSNNSKSARPLPYGLSSSE